MKALNENELNEVVGGVIPADVQAWIDRNLDTINSRATESQKKDFAGALAGAKASQLTLTMDMIHTYLNWYGIKYDDLT